MSPLEEIIVADFQLLPGSSDSFSHCQIRESLLATCIAFSQSKRLKRSIHDGAGQRSTR